MRAFAIILVILTLCFSMSVNAKKHKDKTLGKKQAVKLVTNKYPGKVLKIKSLQHNYKVRVLQKKGRVLDVTVNKKNGTIKKD